VATFEESLWMPSWASRLLQPKLVRFVIVGGGAAGLLFCLSYLFNWLGAPQIVGSPLAYGCCFVVAYSLQRGWTFRGRHAHGHALPRYLIAQLACAALSGLVGQAAAHLGAPRWGASGAATLAASAASYFTSLYWVFGKDAERPTATSPAATGSS
jgi:putative flippase GtrA